MSFHMFDITNKKKTFRRVVAVGSLRIHNREAYEGLQHRSLPKGDALSAAEIAGIGGIKQTPYLLPLCHPLSIEGAAIHFEFQFPILVCYASVHGYGKTGYEMEALMGVHMALLTVYDFLKPLDPSLVFLESKIVYKEGGKSGVVGTLPFEEKKASSKKSYLSGLSCAVIVLSDRAYEGTYEDESGVWLVEAMKRAGAQSVKYHLQQDEPEALKEVLLRYSNIPLDMIITTGGTGLSPRDITPDVVRRLSRIDFTELGDYLRLRGFKDTPYSYLSRATAGVIQNTLVVTFPGRLKAVKENLTYLLPMVSHTLQMIHDGKHDRGNTIGNMINDTL